MMNMLNASMTECCWFPLCMMINRMFYFNAFPLSILFMQFLSMYMFMGLLACCDSILGHVLFIGWRNGDVTVWYQSSCCNMGLHEPA